LVDKNFTVIFCALKKLKDGSEPQQLLLQTTPNLTVTLQSRRAD